MVLLVLLVTLVTSSAVSVAVLSVVYERMRAPIAQNPDQATIIQQTISRITHKDDPVMAPDPAPVERSRQERVAGIADLARSSLVRLNFGSQPSAVGAFVSDDGAILSATRLNRNRRYSIAVDNSLIFYGVVAQDHAYSLLRPIKGYAHRPEAHIPIGTPTIAVGRPAVIFGGFGEDERLFDEIVSQVRTGASGMPLARTSVDGLVVAAPSVVFVGDAFVGFIPDNSGWVSLVDRATLFTNDTAER